MVLIGIDSRELIARFVAAGICTPEDVHTFAGWKRHEQRTFMKEDVGLTPFQAMEIVHRVSQHTK